MLQPGDVVGDGGETERLPRGHYRGPSNGSDLDGVLSEYNSPSSLGFGVNVSQPPDCAGSDAEDWDVDIDTGQRDNVGGDDAAGGPSVGAAASVAGASLAAMGGSMGVGASGSGSNSSSSGGGGGGGGGASVAAGGGSGGGGGAAAAPGAGAAPLNFLRTVCSARPRAWLFRLSFAPCTRSV